MLLAALFNGAPTAISQRCPGAPCSGLTAPVAAVEVVELVVEVPTVAAAGAVDVVIVFGVEGAVFFTLRSPVF